MKHHLTILKKVHLDRILRGRKTVECRLSRIRRAPFKAVKRGDRLWLKLTGGPVVAVAKVRKVECLHPLDASQLRDLQTHYTKAIQANRAFFQSHRQARFATLIHLGVVQAVEPFTVSKRDRRGWVVLPSPPHGAPMQRKPAKSHRS